MPAARVLVALACFTAFICTDSDRIRNDLPDCFLKIGEQWIRNYCDSTANYGGLYMIRILLPALVTGFCTYLPRS